MSERPLISYSEFAAKIAAEQEEVFVWADLDRFDYDPPKERSALVSWCCERVDEYGEVHAGYWNVVAAGDSAKRHMELHDLGVMYFGLPPWRRSQVVAFFGRLGSLEKAVEALPGPAADFLYSFAYEFPDAVVAAAEPGRRVSRARAAEVLNKPLVNEDARQRARWRRARRPERSAQGELF